MVYKDREDCVRNPTVRERLIRAKSQALLDSRATDTGSNFSNFHENNGFQISFATIARGFAVKLFLNRKWRKGREGFIVLVRIALERNFPIICQNRER